MRYTFQWAYYSSLVEARYDEGTTVDLDDVLAAAILADSPGVIEPADKPKPAAKAKTTKTRKATASRNRQKTDSEGDR